jgi:predicted NBD/HSP70 family sugar kinase
MTADAPLRQAALRSENLRIHNLGLVLRHVAASPSVLSRAEVAAGTGLTKATVSSLVDDLIGGGLLIETEPSSRGGAGRPGVGLRLATDGPAGLGIEIGSYALTACLVDLAGTVRHAGHHAGGPLGRPVAEVLDDVAALIREALEAARADGVTVAGVAVAVAGLVADGVVRSAASLQWSHVDVRAELAARLPRLPELVLDNAVSLAALGELHACGEPDFLYIGGDAEVGAGIVLRGELYRGARGYAGELGHVTIRPDGAYCRCGARGCLDAHAGPAQILTGAGLGPDGSLTRLVALAKAGAHPALMALEEAGSALGVAAANAINLLDVDTVVLGGAFATLAPWLVGPVSREITDRVAATAWAPVTVRAATLGASATVLGAAGSVIHAIRDSPATWLAA